MEIRKLVIIGFIILFILAGKSLAYEPWNTHAALTSETIRWYNTFYDPDISDQAREWIIQGSAEEDTAPRWFQHFYDPIKDQGLNGLNTSSKKWAMSPAEQAEYVLGDFSWPTGITESVNDNDKRAFMDLGHVLHLLQDASVPDHTRNDIHPEGSLYEEYAKQFNIQNFTIKNLLKDDVVLSGSVEQLFYSIASYSNQYFFSKDTINNYSLPRIIDYDIASNYYYAYNFDENGKKYYLYKKNRDTGEINIKDTSNKNLILQDYWSHLSKQAVLHGIGAIKLFHNQVQIALEQKQKKSFLTRLGDSVKDVFNSMYNSGIYAVDSPIKVFSQPPSNFSYEPGEVLGISTEAVPSPTPPKTSTQALLPALVPTLLQPQPSSSPASSNSGLTFDPSQLLWGSALYPTIQNPKQETPKSTTTSTIYTGGGSGGGGGSGSNNDSDNDNGDSNDDDSDDLPDTTPPDVPSGLTPATNSTIYPEDDTLPLEAGTQITISGTKTADTEKIYINTVSENTIYPSATTWQKSVTLISGANNFSITARDAADNESTTVNYVINYVNAVVPDVSITITNYRPTSLKFTVTWASTDLSVINYDVEYKIGSGDFQLWKTATTTTSADFIADTDQVIYTFRARSHTSQRVSPWQETSAEIFLQAVVINEVAWMGTGASTSDEWIELYNNTGAEIDLTGWQLKASDNTPSISLVNTIPAHGFFLLERVDNNTISTLIADQIYTGALNDGGEQLNLINDEDRAIDTVYMSFNWIAGDRDTNATMERINPKLFSYATDNWATAVSQSAELDQTENQIFGTPKQTNSTQNLSKTATYPVTLDSVINRDLVLSDVNGIYETKNDGITVYSNTHLVIKSGSVLKSKATLLVGGYLNAQGTETNNIVFTSYKDSDYGGTGGASFGDWGGIKFNSSADSNSIIKNSLIRYGGLGGQNAYGGVGLAISATVSNNTIEKSVIGVAVSAGSPEIRNNIIKENYVGMNLNGTPIISNNEIKDSTAGQGIIIDGGTITLNSNTINNNFSEAIKLNSLTVELSGSNNTATGNNVNSIWFNTPTTSGNLTLTNIGLPYAFSTNLNIRAEDTLTIPAGTKLKLGGYISVNGKLVANGTSTNRILFSSLYDSTVDGTGWIGGRTFGASRDWGSVQLYNTATGSEISYADFLYGGNAFLAQGALHLSGVDMNMTNLLFDKNSFGLTLENSASTITQSSFMVNENFGLKNRTAGTTVTATDNYWGDTTGPRHANNPTGIGDQVSDDVIFDPFLTASP